MSDGDGVERQVGDAAMLGIVGRACSAIRNGANVYLNIGGTERYWISRDSLITLEALASVGNSNCGVILSRLAFAMRDALVYVTGSSEDGWMYHCADCKAEGDGQTFKHAERCVAVAWDRFTSDWRDLDP